MIPTEHPRLRFTQWKGYSLYVADYSNLPNTREVLALLKQSMAVVANAPPHSVYAFNDYTNTLYDVHLINEVRKAAPHFNRYLAAQAIIGMNAMQRIVFNNVVKAFKMRVFVGKTDVEAKNWLVECIREDERRVGGNDWAN